MRSPCAEGLTVSRDVSNMQCICLQKRRSQEDAPSGSAQSAPAAKLGQRSAFRCLAWALFTRTLMFLLSRCVHTTLRCIHWSEQDSICQAKTKLSNPFIGLLLTPKLFYRSCFVHHRGAMPAMPLVLLVVTSALWDDWALFLPRSSDCFTCCVVPTCCPCVLCEHCHLLCFTARAKLPIFVNIAQGRILLIHAEDSLRTTNESRTSCSSHLLLWSVGAYLCISFCSLHSFCCHALREYYLTLSVSGFFFFLFGSDATPASGCFLGYKMHTFYFYFLKIYFSLWSSHSCLTNGMPKGTWQDRNTKTYWYISDAESVNTFAYC